MRLSDLQNKDIVDVISGEKLGNISDIEVNSTNGLIEKIYIYNKRGFFSIMKTDENIIFWKQIKKIGEDVILIDKNT